MPVTPSDDKLKPALVIDDKTALAKSSHTHQHYIQVATAANTRRSYRSAIRHFERWGGKLPADEMAIISYLLAYADTLNPRTLTLRLTALRQWHLSQGFVDPTVGTQVSVTLRGIQRTHGQPKQKAKVLSMVDIDTMVNHLRQQSGAIAIRDCAVILMGFFGAFRRSELVSICVENITWESEGILVLIPKSKTDQTGQGIIKAIPRSDDPLCAVQALTQWLSHAKINGGSVFRSCHRGGQIKTSPLAPASINDILKRTAKQCQFDFVPELSSHSLRRSFSTQAHRAGASFAAIKRQGGWQHDGTVWEYIDEAQRFEDNAAQTLLNKIKQRS